MTNPRTIVRGTPKAGTQPGSGGPQRSRTRRLDPEAETLLKLYNLAMRRRPVERYSLHQRRQSWRMVALAMGRSRAVARVESLQIPGPDGPIELRLYRPALHGGPRPAFVWYHGGGFLMGGPDTADTICRHLALVSGAVVAAVRYRLAPEHDLYAGRRDCLAALDWLASNGRGLGIDPDRLAVGGDSAGGNLAAAVAQHCAQRGTPALRLQVLVYPATNLRDAFPSKAENASGYLLTAEIMDWIGAILLQRSPDLSDPWLSPALNPELRGLPPALILTAGFDPIRDDGLAYAEQLRGAGLPVELLHYAGQFHGFLNFDGVLRAARDALDRIGTALQRALHATDDAVPAVPDRTVELWARVRPPPAALDLSRSMLIAGLMAGERMEHWRNALAHGLLPGRGWAGALAGSALLNPVGALRSGLGARFAPLDASETYARGAVEAVRRR